ncbi:hypothetical protein [Actibacterium sp. XHP0104]|uniref:hypothetical protein n=1 Tax=Actibacterium sp. XHP0104 TaxID=2984335 RepID=UPI0021E78D82|nr:hypothetical protein [Actibacterium sp. XHP0104]MCV2882624.1 hypothetical protein [Actibacterium sp. XHP0104]
MVLVGKLIAWALIILGALRVAMGTYVATQFIEFEAYEAATKRYLGSGTSGDAIDKGLMFIAAGVAFGLLARCASQRGNASNPD